MTKCHLTRARMLSGSTSALEGIQVNLGSPSSVVPGDRVTLVFLLMGWCAVHKSLTHPTVPR